MLVEERPRWDHNQECQRSASQTDVECLVDVLGDEADYKGQYTRDGEEDGADLLGEALTFEILQVASVMGLESAARMDRVDVQSRLHRLSGLVRVVDPSCIYLL